AAVGFSGAEGDDTRHGYTSPDGTELVPAWDCDPESGCPVAEMDRQSGDVGGGNHTHRRETPAKPRGRGWGNIGFPESGNSAGIGDSGGASRFFPTFAWEDSDFAPFR